MHAPPHDVIDSLAILICGLDDDGRIIMFNRPAEQVTGLARTAVLGTRWLDVFAPGERHDQVTALWRQAAPDSPTGPYEALCRNQRSLRWQFSRAPTTPAPGVALWAVGVDVTGEREAAARAREAERHAALSNLVSGLTHQLRNPLNGALLQLALAERHETRAHDGQPSPTGRAVGHAIAEIRRISALLDDFLVFVRPLPLRLERRDLRALVTRAIDRARARAAAVGVAVTLAPGEPVHAEVDSARIEAALYQLLANAIDASAEAAASVVTARVEPRRNTVVVSVADHGAGLPTADAPIYEPFFTTKQGGTGLGLAIVNSVATDHGGRVSHARVDGTTRFELALPIVAGSLE